MGDTIQQIVLARRCEAAPVEEDFCIETAPMPKIEDGQVLLKTHYISLDPYLRSKISGRHMSGGVAVGEVMAGEVVGEIVESRHPDFAVGDLARSHAGWRSFAAVDGKDAYKVNLPDLPMSLSLGVLGMPGLAAYAGVTRLAEVKAGDTFVVSAASGPVGSMAAQVARMKGASTIGIAGSKEKCDWCLDIAKFDDVINYREEDLREGIKRTCPDGVSVYFDNVGGDVLEAAAESLAIGGRIVLCGLAAEYNSETRLPGPRPGLFIIKRATVRGLVVYDHEDLRAELEQVGGDWIRSGDIAYNEDVAEGISDAPAAFARLCTGKNFGKAVVKLV